MTRTPILIKLLPLAAIMLVSVCHAADVSPTMPGKGLAQHDFLYAGEAKTRDVYIVRAGKVDWEFHDTSVEGEISDAVMASNGNIVIAHQHGVKVIDQSRKTLWAYTAEEKHEIHTAQFIGNDKVIFIQSGLRPRIMVANIKTNTVEREVAIPAGNLANTHGQLRHARLTSTGTYLVAQMDMKRAVEFDSQGKEVWSLPFPGIWSAKRLDNGNTLITGKTGVFEYNNKAEIVWSLIPEDLAVYKYTSFQIAQRLPNGNTLLNHWVNQWSPTGANIDPATAPAQLLEVTPDKKVVWALHQWKEPNLGPSTTVQILDAMGKTEQVYFGDVR